MGDEFNVIIEAKHYRGYRGDMAIDDVKFENCASGQVVVGCTVNEFRCADKKQCIPRKYLCDRRFDCGDHSDEDPEVCDAFKNVKDYCDFDNGFKPCGYYFPDDKDTQKNWMVGKSTSTPILVLMLIILPERVSS